MITNEQLTPNFWLYEFLNTTQGQRYPTIMEQQFNPSASVVSAIRYQTAKIWQPVRNWFGCAMTPTSGYRCPELNKLVGSQPTSQHLLGEAGDMGLYELFKTEPRCHARKAFLDSEVTRVTGKKLRPDVNANFYLFVYICLNLDSLDVDQVIHEYGLGAGKPAWVHAAGSTRINKRQILLISNTGTTVLDLKQALLLGC